MLRKIAMSYWTAGVIGAGLFAAHGWWLARSTHAGEVISGFGASLVVLGIFVGARPYIRVGVGHLINMGLPSHGAGFYSSDQSVNEHQERVKVALPQVTRDVWAERVLAVVVVVLGTILNGYGTPIARLFDMKV